MREVLIHRTCALTGAEYEWGVHVVGFGRPLGLSETQIASTVHGHADEGLWSGAERAAFGLADALHHTATVSDALFAELWEHFSEEQVLELCLAGGWYHAISYVVNVAAVMPEPWAARFPPARPA